MLVQGIYTNQIGDLLVSMPIDITATFQTIIDSNETVKKTFLEKINQAIHDVLSCEDIHSIGHNLMFCLPVPAVTQMLQIQTDTGISMNQLVVEALRRAHNIDGMGIISPTSKGERISDALNSLAAHNEELSNKLDADSVAKILKNDPDNVEIEIESIVIPTE